MNKAEKVKESVKNLQEYLLNDTFYNGETKIESDFDKFCYKHCEDIANILEVIPKRYKEE